MNGQHDDIARLQKAYKIIGRLEQENAELKQSQAEPIAITGLACRFPGGANTPTEFWDRLQQGYDAAVTVPASRWDQDFFYDPNPGTPGKICSRNGCFLDVDIDRFDAAFFGISPREARGMDPQQRLLLEVAWEAIESAGYPEPALRGSQAGVFVGIGSGDFAESIARSGDFSAFDAYYNTGTTASVAAGRISHVLGLKGPCMAVDAACASGLVTAHLASQSLRAGECDVALAGGVNLLLSPLASIGLAQAGMLSPEGKCKAFDADADGYVRGEGCGVLVLKRLSDARRDGDTIWAVLRGTAVNQCGDDGGLITPSKSAQIDVIETALKDAGVNPADLDYIEANGTGAPLGDIAEIAALGTVYRNGRQPSETLAIGSVKTNIGHLETAAGLAGMIKVIGVLNRNLIPKHLHLDALHPELELDSIPAFIPNQNTPWAAKNQPRRCAVHAFGFCGTNAHVIIEEATELPASETTHATDTDPPVHLVTLSAKNNRALSTVADRFKAFCESQDRLDLADVAFTTHTGRSHFRRRTAIVSRSIDDLCRRMETRQVLEGSAHLGKDPKVVFMFTGHGCHYSGMGRTLYASQPVFRSAMQRIAELVDDRLAEHLIDVIFDRRGKGGLLAQARYHHAATFAIEYALATLWRSWGVVPEAVIGHGLGEYVANAWTGAISLDDGLNLALSRGDIIEFMQSRVRSLCLQTGIAEAERAQRKFEKKNAQVIRFAAINNPREVISTCATDVFKAWSLHLRREGIPINALNVPQIDPDLISMESLAAFRKTADNITAQVSPSKFISSSSAANRAGRAVDQSYWEEQLLVPIDFNTSIQRLLREHFTVFVEIGPHHPITYAAHRFKKQGDVLWLPSLCHGEEDWAVLLKSLGLLYVHGYDVDWDGYEEPFRSRRKKVQIPFYPFDRQSYRPKTSDNPPTGAPHGERVHPLLGVHVPSPRDDVEFAGSIDAERLDFDKAFQLFDHAVFPASGFIEMFVAAARFVLRDETATRLEDVRIHQLPELTKYSRQVRVIAVPEDRTGAYRLTAYIRSDGAENGAESLWEVAAECCFKSIRDVVKECDDTIEAIQSRCDRHFTKNAFYREVLPAGLTLGGAFQSVQDCWCGAGEALLRFATSEQVMTAEYVAQSSLLETGFLAAAMTLSSGNRAARQEDIRLVETISSVVLSASFPAEVYVHAVSRSDGVPEVSNLTFLDRAGNVLAYLGGLRFQVADRRNIQHLTNRTQYLDRLLYRPGWTPRGDDNTDGQMPIDDVAILHHDPAVCDEWAANFRGRAQRVIQADRHGVDVTDESQLTAWLTALHEQGHQISHLVYVCRDETQPMGDWVNDFNDCRATFALIHSVFKAALPQLPHLMIITSDACAFKNGTLTLEQAPLPGLLASLAVERPELSLSRIDFTTETPISQRADVVKKEMTRGPAGMQVAFRDQQVFAPVLLPFHDAQPLAQSATGGSDARPTSVVGRATIRDQKPSALAQSRNRVMVVTGGAGRLGASVAKGLFEHGFKHFALVDDQPLSSETQAIVQEIEARGARVKTAVIDCSDYEQTVSFLECLRDESPPVAGIIHAAGCEREAYLLQEDWCDVETVFDRKVRSAGNLHRATLALEMELDYFVCFSSLAALNGLPEKGVEAAADAFLDALVWQRRRSHLAAQTINWSGWVDPDALLRRTAYTIAGIHALPIEMGVEALHRVMLSGQPQVLVADANWSIYQGIFPVAKQWCGGIDDDNALHAEQESNLKSRILATDATTALEIIKAEIRHVVRIMLDLPSEQDVGDREDFQALGIDSLMGVQMLAMLKHIFADTFVLKNVALLELATVEKLGWHVLREIHKIVEWDDPIMEDRPSSGVFTLSSSGAEPPLFVLSGLDGLAISFFALAQALSSDRPIYVLQDPQLTDGLHFESLEELAAHEIEQMRSVQPRDPYFLLGWSMGGAVVYEMVMQLEACGDAIAFAGILEGAAWRRTDDAEEYQLHDLLKLILLDLLTPPEEIDKLLAGESFAVDHEEAVLARIAEFIGQKRLLPEDQDVLDGLHYGRCLLQNVKMLMRYELTGDVQQLTILEAETNLAEMLDEPASHLSLAGWARHSREPAITASVPGNHLTIMQEPHVQVLGKRLHGLIEQVKLFNK